MAAVHLEHMLRAQKKNRTDIKLGPYPESIKIIKNSNGKPHQLH